MDSIKQSLEQFCSEKYNQEVRVVFNRPQAQFGDWATNVALQLAGLVGASPREIAQELAETIRLLPDVASVEVAGPGFINITLADSSLVQQLGEPFVQSSVGMKILAEYSDPNPFKPLHAGHLYTTLVGDTISRLLENTGAEVIRLNFGGDVGLHVARCMWAILQELDGENPEKLSQIPEDQRAQWLGDCYVQGTSAYEDDEEAKKDIIELNKRIYSLQAAQDKVSAFAQIYWQCRQWSYDYFEKLYKQLEVKPFDRFMPESTVTEMGVQAVLEQLEKGVYTRSNGAIVFVGEEYGLHTRVFINSEGLPTYETKDVGLILTKWQDYHFDRSIVITASEQAQYMQVMLKSVEQFLPEPAQRTTHITHGVVKLQGGVKMSSRQGNTVGAIDILESAQAAAQDTGRNVEYHTVLAAVKYAFAKTRIGSDIIYDPKESIALEGNSGPYIQYAHARARSILSKAGASSLSTPQNFQPEERRVLGKLVEYKDVIQRATEELMPHHICTYLYELAQTFNRFYEDNRVIGDTRQAERLWLVNEYAKILKSGLELLGITAPEQM